MKKIVISSIFALFMQLSYSQIQIQQPDSRVIVGKYNSGAYTHSELSYRIKDDKDTLYTLIFLNAEYRVIKEYTTFQFSGENNTCNQL